MLTMEIINRQASYNYYIDETYETGIVLTGTEIKSIRNGACNLKDSYAIIKNGEIYLLNTHISPYKQGNIFNHEETRTRKLLLHKKEILKISNKVNIEGYTLIPLKIYFKKSKAKLLLGVCRGKKNYNKIQVLKEKDLAREMAKNTKFR